MTAGDEEALNWDGVGDPTHAPAEAPVATPGAKVKKPKDAAPAASEPAKTEPVVSSGPSSLALVSYGILGGMYLLFTAGWLIMVLTDKRAAFETVLTEVMYQAGEYLAIASPALWFGTALLLTRRRRVLTRILVLLLGLPLVVPWPFILLGAPR
jgi:hypothetical protein